MKYILLVCCLCLSAGLLAQEPVHFRGYLKSACSEKITELKEYTLRKKGFFFSSLNDGPIAPLPDTGTYLLESTLIAAEGDSLLIHIGPGLNVDTVKKRDLIDVVFIDSKPPAGMSQGGGWLYCGQPGEGFHVDYYNNGKKMIEGTFKHGQPVGELKFYSMDGALKYVSYYDKRGKVIKSEHVQGAQSKEEN